MVIYRNISDLQWLFLNSLDLFQVFEVDVFKRVEVDLELFEIKLARFLIITPVNFDIVWFAYCSPRRWHALDVKRFQTRWQRRLLSHLPLARRFERVQILLIATFLHYVESNFALEFSMRSFVHPLSIYAIMVLYIFFICVVFRLIPGNWWNLKMIEAHLILMVDTRLGHVLQGKLVAECRGLHSARRIVNSEAALRRDGFDL